mmetsp:Transcript_79894/g.231924  ORF Transcript_79894/g.231924 Transcript_79894/m.231924 type:complete len:310 (-) Transcript_79894:656-1585(-)
MLPLDGDLHFVVRHLLDDLQLILRKAEDSRQVVIYNDDRQRASWPQAHLRARFRWQRASGTNRARNVLLCRAGHPRVAQIEVKLLVFLVRKIVYDGHLDGLGRLLGSELERALDLDEVAWGVGGAVSRVVVHAAWKGEISSGANDDDGDGARVLQNRLLRLAELYDAHGMVKGAVGPLARRVRPRPRRGRCVGQNRLGVEWLHLSRDRAPPPRESREPPLQNIGERHRLAADHRSRGRDAVLRPAGVLAAVDLDELGYLVLGQVGSVLLADSRLQLRELLLRHLCGHAATSVIRRLQDVALVDAPCNEH